MDTDFWQYLDKLVATSSIIIDRPRGASHPRFPDLSYPLDYGYLADTSSTDKSGIDVWIGSNQDNSLESLVCTCDLDKRDVEKKLLFGCSEENCEAILDFHNSGMMRAFLIHRT